MIKTITEKKREIPVLEAFDVLVVGGGISGISAALSAARSGAKTMLVEREFALGGLATLGLVTYYLPLCDGCGRQVSFGIAEELLRLAIEYGTETECPIEWLKNPRAKKSGDYPRFTVQHNATLLALAAERVLINAGVKILYGTLLRAAQTAGNKITEGIFENKSGTFAIEASNFVDATGDADLAHFAGEATRNFAQGNILASWYYVADEKGVQLHPMGACDVPDEYKNGNGPEMLSQRRFSGLDGAEISEMVIMSHSIILDDIKKRRAIARGSMPVTMAGIPQLRMTRCVSGPVVMDDKNPHAYCKTSIGMIGDWRKRGPVYELPFEILRGEKFVNLYTAGRCISVTDSMWDITRVIPCCAVTGQAAGVAAALSRDFPADIQSIQCRLTTDGVILHESEL